MEIRDGDIFTVECPFILDKYTEMTEEGYCTFLSYRPGVKWEFLEPDSSEPVCHGVGTVTYKVVSYHKLPHPYPDRVFFTRKFKSPDGREFGKNRLLVLTKEAFSRRAKAYLPGGVDRYDGVRIKSLTDEDRNEIRNS